MLPRRLLLPLLVFTAFSSASAQASPGQLSVMMDDDNLIYRTPTTADKTLDAMAGLGVDRVRVTVLWKVIAERARNSKAKDRRFRKLGADDPKAYPKGNWDRYDHLVQAAGARGIGVYFNVTGPGPEWCCPKPPKGEEENASTWMPNAREFKLFVEAVGKRYSGKYEDENSRAKKRKDRILPRVSFWSLWNEPNQGGWLTPQFWHGRAYSPSLFRSLYIKGHEGLVATGHGDDVILLGETAPNGKNENRSRAPMYPTTFIKTLFCVDGNGNRKSGGPGCNEFTENGPLLATAYAHHPYTKDRAPLTRDPSDQAITMANLDDLTRLLDKVADKTSRIQKQIPLALTEFGYETQPPDPFNGVSLTEQAEYSNVADIVSWANPRVLTQTQFLLRDVKPLKSSSERRRWFTYQSGLFYANGRPKPAAAAYALPFVANPTGATTDDGKTKYVVWGQLRFRPNSKTDIVYFQHRASGTNTWTTISAAQTTGRNYFTQSVDSPGPGSMRAVWGGSDAPKLAISRSVTVK
jgi:hypothetical protein